MKKGKATIKAKVGKKTYTFKITVKAPALSQKKLNVTVGSKATVKLNGTKITPFLVTAATFFYYWIQI